MKYNELENLCIQISMPKEALEQIKEAFETMAPYPEEELDKLLHKETWKEGLAVLKDTYSQADKGIPVLITALQGALKTKENYDKLGISDKVFYDTMACFSRFVKEHKESFGMYGFDREWWTTRQLSCLLFRLETLEFEIGEFQNEPSLCIHIPSDAVITPEKCRESLEMAEEFFGKYFPQFKYAHMSCSSWLLAPSLQELLPEKSNIVKFQKLFTILNVQPDDKEYISWIFKNDKLPIEQLPENTSLQRNVKKYMLDGKNIGSGEGIILRK